jgi:hypothetical protein
MGCGNGEKMTTAQDAFGDGGASRGDRMRFILVISSS